MIFMPFHRIARQKDVSQYMLYAKAVKEAFRRILAGYSAEGAITSWPFLTQQCGKYMHCRA